MISFWTGEDEPLIGRNLREIRQNSHLISFHLLLLVKEYFLNKYRAFKMEIACKSESGFKYESINS